MLRSSYVGIREEVRILRWLHIVCGTSYKRILKRYFPWVNTDFSLFSLELEALPVTLILDGLLHVCLVK